jgi:asparagine synthetase B (glutamine-hydrolysing)
MFLLSGLVHEAGIKVVLTGEGADEMFAGYDLFREARLRRFWKRPAFPGGRGGRRGKGTLAKPARRRSRPGKGLAGPDVSAACVDLQDIPKQG